MEVSLELFEKTMADLEPGQVRAAQKIDGHWQVNAEIKQIILAGFAMGRIKDMSEGQFAFFDKDTFPVREFSTENSVRIVPGGSSIRRGAYVAPGAIVMPPHYVNDGAFVDEGTMVDSHVPIGTCAQAAQHKHI